LDGYLIAFEYGTRWACGVCEHFAFLCVVMFFCESSKRFLRVLSEPKRNPFFINSRPYAILVKEITCFLENDVWIDDFWRKNWFGGVRILFWFWKRLGLR
jgi:hypothetical protein